MYTIGQVSEMFNIPVSTLRYYDKEGLFPDMERKSGRRSFGEKEMETLRVIGCLKNSGLEIKDIGLFMQWVKEGPSTYEQRKELFEKRREVVEQEMERLQKTLNLLKYKCWYYETALKDGNEDGINSMLPDHLPEEIQKYYDNCRE